MKADQNIEQYKADVFSDDWERMIAGCNSIFEIGTADTLDYLITLLDHENSSIRDAVALTFRRNNYNKAVESLFASINKKANVGYTGTMVYVLQSLDCSSKLKELFELLFNGGSYEVKNHVLTILDEQEFEFSREDLIAIKNKWDECKETWDLVNNIDPDNPGKNDIHKGVIQEYVDAYMLYLSK